MKAVITLLLSTLLFTQSSDPIKVVGNWEGKISVQGTSLKIVFHIKNQNGKLEATMDSPDQNAHGFKMEDVTFKDDVLRMKLNLERGKGSYEGKLKDGKFEGKWTQLGQTVDLNLSKVKRRGTS